MASKRDMRRDELVIPYLEPEKDKDQNDISATLGQTIPMAAMFTRNKMIAWVAVVFTLQGWLAETPDQRKASGTPAYFSVMMSALALIVSYLPFFMPPVVPTQSGTGTASKPPEPPTH